MRIRSGRYGVVPWVLAALMISGTAAAESSRVLYVGGEQTPSDVAAILALLNPPITLEQAPEPLAAVFPAGELSTAGVQSVQACTGEPVDAAGYEALLTQLVRATMELGETDALLAQLEAAQACLSEPVTPGDLAQVHDGRRVVAGVAAIEERVAHDALAEAGVALGHAAVHRVFQAAPENVHVLPQVREDDGLAGVLAAGSASRRGASGVLQQLAIDGPTPLGGLHLQPEAQRPQGVVGQVGASMEDQGRHRGLDVGRRHGLDAQHLVCAQLAGIQRHGPTLAVEGAQKIGPTAPLCASRRASGSAPHSRGFAYGLSPRQPPDLDRAPGALPCEASRRQWDSRRQSRPPHGGRPGSQRGPAGARCSVFCAAVPGGGRSPICRSRRCEQGALRRRSAGSHWIQGPAACCEPRSAVASPTGLWKARSAIAELA